MEQQPEELYVETFPPFDDLPEYSFLGEEPVIHQKSDLTVRLKRAGHYLIYQLRYELLPEVHPEGTTYIVYDIEALEEQRKVYKFFDRNGEELTLGEATYDIGLLFSEGRVLSDTHFIGKAYEKLGI